jgi:hypothetical protein
MTIISFDVTTAFLYGKLKEEVYVNLPTEMNKDSNKCFKLLKGLYGLKQSPNIWYDNISQIFTENGYQMLKSDKCVF